MTVPIPAFSASDVKPVPADQPKPVSRDAAREEGRRKKAEADALRRQQEALLEQFKSKAGRERDLVDGMMEYKLVPIDDLVPDPEQPRKILRRIGELAATIKSEGLLQPVTARVGEPDDPRLYMVYGHRRLAAMKELGWSHVPTMIRLKKTTKSRLVQQLMENFHQETMDLMDQALALRELMREEKIATYQECADRIGKSLTFVTQRIALLDLDEPDQKRILNKTLTLAEGAKIARERVGNTRNRASKPVTDSRGFSDTRGRGAASPSFGPVTTRGHFTETHYLAGRARSRCRAQSEVDADNHKPIIGGVGCGKCWEVVIRLDAHRNPDIVFRPNE